MLLLSKKFLFSYIKYCSLKWCRYCSNILTFFLLYLSFSQIHLSNIRLLEELCEEQAFLYIVPDNVQKRKHQRKIDNELQVLKNKLSADNGKNVVLSNRELRLLKYYG